MLKTLLIADTRSLYFNLRDKYPGHSLSYLDLQAKLEKDLGLMFTYKYAYGNYEPDKCHKFHTLLVETGYRTFFDEKYYDSHLALKAAEAAPNVDAIVLATCWYAHYPILEYFKNMGKLTWLVGINIPRRVNYICKPIEITPDLIRRKDVTNGTDATT